MTQKTLEEVRAELVAEYGGEPTGSDAVVLESLLDVIKVLRSLTAEVAASPMVTGSRGQPVTNPASSAQADLLARQGELLERWTGAVEFRQLTSR